MVGPRQFATTWWGKAWVDALEQRARLDPNRLPRGRTYARKGQVRAIELTPGEIRALVHGSRATPYAVRIGIRQFSDHEWNRLLDAVAARAGHAAALLEGELDPAIVEDAARVEVNLLPGPGELTPRCSCPDWADPCKHSAAVCYLVAAELDTDPFSLLLMRGRPRERVLAELRGRRLASTGTTARGGAAARAGLLDPGITAREAWDRTLGELPLPPHRRDQPGHPAPLSVDPPAHVGFTAASLTDLADDAARRAWRLLRGEADSGLALDETADLGRRASDAIDAGGFTTLVDQSGRRARDLMADAIAWREGGAPGVRAVREDSWTPPLARMAAGRDAVLANGTAAHQVRIRNNTITISGRTQLRLSRDGSWYRLDKQGGRWELTGPPADEPDDLVFRQPQPLT